MSPTKRLMTGVQGRADLHIHTMASDGTAGVAQVLARAEEARLDVIAITDHDRIDAARAAQAMAIKNKLRVQVIIGEEISTLQGHVLGLFLEERVRPLRSLRRTIAEIHEQGGIAIPAHPLFPHPLCAQAGALRVVANELGLPGVGSSDAHVLEAIGRVYTTFPGRSAAALRRAILAGTVKPGAGEDHTVLESPAIFARQMLRNLIGLGQDLRGVTRPIWTLGGERHGRDLGYPQSHKRPVKQR